MKSSTKYSFFDENFIEILLYRYWLMSDRLSWSRLVRKRSSYSSHQWLAWKLISSSFRKNKFGHHGSPLTSLNLEFFKTNHFRKFATINFWLKFWILHIREQLGNPYNFCAGCALWVENYEMAALWSCLFQPISLIEMHSMLIKE